MIFYFIHVSNELNDIFILLIYVQKNIFLGVSIWNELRTSDKECNFALDNVRVFIIIMFIDRLQSQNEGYVMESLGDSNTH